MASQASRIAERRHRRVPPVRMPAAQRLRGTRPAAGRAGNRAALRLPGPGFRVAWRASRRATMARTSYAIALGSNRRSRHGSPAATLRAALAALDG